MWYPFQTDAITVWGGMGWFSSGSLVNLSKQKLLAYKNITSLLGVGQRTPTLLWQHIWCLCLARSRDNVVHPYSPAPLSLLHKFHGFTCMTFLVASGEQAMHLKTRLNHCSLTDVLARQKTNASLQHSSIRLSTKELIRKIAFHQS